MAHHRLRSRFYRFFFSIDSLPQRLFVLSEEKLSPTERRHFCFVKKSRRPQPILAAKGQSKGEFIVSSSWKRVEKGSRRFFFGRTDDLGFEPVWVVEDHKRNEETKKKTKQKQTKTNAGYDSGRHRWTGRGTGEESAADFGDSATFFVWPKSSPPSCRAVVNLSPLSLVNRFRWLAVAGTWHRLAFTNGDGW